VSGANHDIFECNQQHCPQCVR